MTGRARKTRSHPSRRADRGTPDRPPDRGGRPPLAPRPKPAPPDPPLHARRLADPGRLVRRLVRLVWVGYLHLLYFSGVLGFAVCWYLVFVVLYAAVVAVSNPRPGWSNGW